MTGRRDRSRVSLPLPPLDAATAAWLVDVLATLQQAIFQRYGDAIEAYWTETDPPGQRQRGRLGDK